MKCERALLIKALDLLKHTADRKSTLPVCSAVSMRIDGGFLELESTNITSLMRVRLEAEGELPWVSVDLAALSIVVKAGKKTAGEPIRLDYADTKAAKLRIGIASRKFRVTTAIREQDWPVRKWKTLHESGELVTETWPRAEIDRALRFVLPAVCRDATRYHLCRMAFHPDGLVATDGHRLHMNTAIEPFVAFGESQTVMTENATAFIAALKACDAGYLKGQTFFPTGGGRQLSRWHIDGRLDVEIFETLHPEIFPPIDKVIPDHADYFSVDAQRLYEAAELAVKSCKSSDEVNQGGVTLFANGELKVSSGNHFEEVLDLDNYDGRDVSMVVSGAYLAQALKGREDASVYYGPSTDGTMLCPIDLRLDNECRAILMPMRGE